jgi:2,4-dienoyl-CoA reductase-like NADH-dependent reductase (Old Yellow Enzyme family)
MNQPSPFDPLTIGPLQLRNRFIKSGANEAMCIDGAPTHALVQHHRALAAGGVGMTTVAYVAVSEEGRTLPNQIWMREAILPDLRVLTAAVHAEGGRSRRRSRTAVPSSPASASGANDELGNGPQQGRAAGRQLAPARHAGRDMDLVDAQFVHTAELAREAGFDAVELHMGHGYLLNQFISPLDNRRRDEYGGNAENRARFPARVLAAVKKAVGRISR